MNSTASALTPIAAVSGFDLVEIECQNRYSVQDVAWADLDAEQVG